MLDLQPIKDRLAAATPGPWESVKKNPIPLLSRLSHLAVVDCCYLIKQPDGVECSWPEADAKLIAHAPTDLTALVAEVERLRDSIASHKRRCVIDPQPWDRDLWAVLDA